MKNQKVQFAGSNRHGSKLTNKDKEKLRNYLQSLSSQFDLMELDELKRVQFNKENNGIKLSLLAMELLKEKIEIKTKELDKN